MNKKIIITHKVDRSILTKMLIVIFKSILKKIEIELLPI